MKDFNCLRHLIAITTLIGTVNHATCVTAQGFEPRAEKREAYEKVQTDERDASLEQQLKKVSIYFPIEMIIQQPGPTIVLEDGHGNAVGQVSVDHAKHYEAAYRSLANLANLTIGFVYVPGDLNLAKIVDIDGQLFFAITSGMAELLDGNADAFAIIAAQRLAHISLGHVHKKNSRKLLKPLAILAQIAAGVAIGAAGGSPTLLPYVDVEQVFSNAEEIDADRLAMTWHKQAGFDPQQAISTYELLRYTSFFSSPDQFAKRIENLRKQV